MLEQARRYLRGATGAGSWHGYYVPFLYATNRGVIWYCDEHLSDALSCQAGALPSPAALADRFTRNHAVAAARLRAALGRYVDRIRPNQERCITAVEAWLATGQRTMLVAAATGSGKSGFLRRKRRPRRAGGLRSVV